MDRRQVELIFLDDSDNLLHRAGVGAVLARHSRSAQLLANVSLQVVRASQAAVHLLQLARGGARLAQQA